MPPKKRQRKRKKGAGIRDFFRGIRTGYDTVSKVGEVRAQYDKANKENSRPKLPPKPDRQRAPKVAPEITPVGLNATLKKYRPLASIDNALKDLGARDYVREKLRSNMVGKLLVNAVDTGIQQGYGRRTMRCISV